MPQSTKTRTKSDLRFIEDIIVAAAKRNRATNYEGTQMGTIVYTQNALLLQIWSLSLYIVEGLGFGTETLAGNFKGKGATEQLVPLAKVSVGMALLVSLVFGEVCWLFPDTVFGLLTNHAEIIENIDIFIPWLVLLLVCNSVYCILSGYFLGLAQGNILRNVSLVAVSVGFLPADIAAVKFESNQILWLAFFLFNAIGMLMFGVQMVRINVSDVEENSVSIPALEASHTLTLNIEGTSQQMVAEKLEVGQD